MARAPSFSPRDLTRHHALAPRWRGYTALDLWKFYGLIAGLWYVFAAVSIRYGQLFNGYQGMNSAEQSAVVLIALPPLLFLLPVVLLFFWWTAGALVKHARWQLAQPLLWRCFWLAILLFYAVVLFDPLDKIHPQMSRKGLAPAPNLAEIFGNWQLSPLPTFQFQWGYGLLWFMFWFLLIALHWSYISDGLREIWFYARRFQRYGVSILLGFRETARLADTAPVTRDYPRVRPVLPPGYRGVPHLNVERLTVDEAKLIRAADASAAFSSPPGQPEVLFIDLGLYDFSPALAALQRADGTALLRFTDYWPLPQTGREALVIPLAGSVGAALVRPSGASKDDQDRTSAVPTGEEASA